MSHAGPTHQSTNSTTDICVGQGMQHLVRHVNHVYTEELVQVGKFLYPLAQHPVGKSHSNLQIAQQPANQTSKHPTDAKW